MATGESTMEFLMEQLLPLTGVRTRKMFGEYAVYLDDKVVGLVCDDQLFVKITAAGRDFLGQDYKEGLPYTGAKPWIVADADTVEDEERLCRLLRITADSLPVPPPKKPRKPKA